MWKFLISLLCVLLLVGGAATAQDGRGLVLIRGSDLSPQLLDHIFPRLYGIDRHTGVLEGAAPGNLALVTDAAPSAEQEQTLGLRDDLRWSDGQPITAHDVLFSLLFSPFGQSEAQNGGYSIRALIEGVGLIDDHSLVVRYKEASCANGPRTNLYIFPTHLVWPDFPTKIKAVYPEAGEVISLQEWGKRLADAPSLFTSLNREEITIPTAGLHIDPPAQSGEQARLSGGDFAMLLVNAQPGVADEETFLGGGTNILLNPAYNRRDDLRGRQDFKVYEAAGWSWDYLVFNMADPTLPRPAFNSHGNPLDQFHHPYFSDKRVRQAVQLGLDLDSIIEVVYQGAATRLPANLPPPSWAYNPDVKLVDYDPAAAARLLDEAGWVDSDGDGIRNCYRCQYARPGSSLSFNLVVQSDGYRERAAEMIAIQLQRIGIGVNYFAGDPGDQRFDLYFGGFNYNSPYTRDPDQSALFTQSGDRLGISNNVGSYYNPQVEELFAQARTIEACAIEKRTALYHDIQALLADDLPAVWLYTRHDMYLARGITNFAPQPGNPFWNLTDWRVTP